MTKFQLQQVDVCIHRGFDCEMGQSWELIDNSLRILETCICMRREYVSHLSLGVSRHKLGIE